MKSTTDDEPTIIIHSKKTIGSDFYLFIGSERIQIQTNQSWTIAEGGGRGRGRGRGGYLFLLCLGIMIASYALAPFTVWLWMSIITTTTTTTTPSSTGDGTNTICKQNEEWMKMESSTHQLLEWLIYVFIPHIVGILLLLHIVACLLYILVVWLSSIIIYEE